MKELLIALVPLGSAGPGALPAYLFASRAKPGDKAHGSIETIEKIVARIEAKLGLKPLA